MLTVLARLRASAAYGNSFTQYVLAVPDAVDEAIEALEDSQSGTFIRRGLIGGATVAGMLTFAPAGLAALTVGLLAEVSNNENSKKRFVEIAVKESAFCNRYAEELGTLLDAVEAVCGNAVVWSAYEATMRHIIISPDSRTTGKAYENPSAPFTSEIVDAIDIFMSKMLAFVGPNDDLRKAVLTELDNALDGLEFRTRDEIRADYAANNSPRTVLRAAPVQAEIVGAEAFPMLPPGRQPAPYQLTERKIDVLGAAPVRPELPAAPDPIITPAPAAPAPHLQAQIERLKLEAEIARLEAEKAKAEAEKLRNRPQNSVNLQQNQPVAGFASDFGDFPDLGSAPVLHPPAQAPAPAFPEPPQVRKPNTFVPAPPAPIPPFTPIDESALIPELASLLADEPEPDVLELTAQPISTVFGGPPTSGKSTLVDNAIDQFMKTYPQAFVGVIDGKSEGRFRQAHRKIGVRNVAQIEAEGLTLPDVQPGQTELFQKFRSELQQHKGLKLLVIDEPTLIMAGFTPAGVREFKDLVNNLSLNMRDELIVWIVSARTQVSFLGLTQETLWNYRRVFVCTPANQEAIAHVRKERFISDPMPAELLNNPLAQSNRYACIKPADGQGRWVPVGHLRDYSAPDRRMPTTLAESALVDHVRKVKQQPPAPPAPKVEPVAPISAPTPAGQSELEKMVDALMDWIDGENGGEPIPNFNLSFARNYAPRAAGGRDYEKIKLVLDYAVESRVLAYDGKTYSRTM